MSKDTLDRVLSLLWETKSIMKAPKEKPPMAQKYGWEFDEDKHRWVLPETDATSYADKELVSDVTSLVEESLVQYQSGDYSDALKTLRRAI